MHAESFDDIFTYVGKESEPTPAEKERRQKYYEEGRKAFQEQWEKMTGEKCVEIIIEE